MKKRFFVLSVLCVLACLSWGQKTMEEKLEAKYGWAIEFEDEGRKWYLVKYNGKKGACDAKGNEIVPPLFDDVHVDYEDKYVKAVKDKQMSIYNLQGKLIMATPYEDVRWYQMKDNNYCEVKQNGLWGVINQKGDLVVPCEFDGVSAFMLKEKDVCSVEKNGKKGVYDVTQKKLLVPCEFDYVSTYEIKERGVCDVKKNGKNGYFSVRESRELVPCQYDAICTNYFPKGNGYVVINDNKYGFVNQHGKEIVPCIYSYLTTQYTKAPYLTAVKGGTRPIDAFEPRRSPQHMVMNGQWGVLDLNGNEVVPFVYDYIDYVKDDVAVVCKGGRIGFKERESRIIDGTKKIHYSCTYEHNGCDCGFYNLKTGKSTPCQYKSALIGEGYIACCNTLEKWGFLDAETMPVVIPFEYESAQAFKNGVAQVKKDGKSTFLTDPKKGTSLTLANGGSSIKVDGNIPVIKEKQEESFAFIIANENYVHLKGADYAINDGKVFKEYCLKTFGMPESNVRYFEDATYGNIVNAVKKIKDIADVYEGDAKIIVYFSGLGTTEATSKERYILPTDASLEALNVTGYSVQTLMDELNSLNTKQMIVILDAPFSGLDKEGKLLGENRGVAIAPKPAVTKGNTVLIAACSGSESAYSMKDYGHSLFTYGLLEKIQDSKGQSSLKEAVEYATTWVKKESLKRLNKTQTPQLQAEDAIKNNLNNIKF